jgi:uncharacterized membrane protein
MSDFNIAVLIFTLVGIVFIGLGVPLFLRRVPPNAWYGCRTTRTLADEKIWYAVNQVTGRDMIIIGLLMIASSLAVFVFGKGLNSTNAMIILLAVLVLSTAAMFVNSLRRLRHM